MKKQLTLLALLFITASMAFAQQNYRDVVYLKNGSIIRGIITEQTPNEQLKIETADGNVFVYQFSDVEKLTREPMPERVKITGAKSSPVAASREREKGYVGIIDAFYGFGVGEYGEDLFGITMVNGYRFNPYFSLGFGTGVKYYPSSEFTMIPLFLDIRANFMNGDIAPFVAIGAGGSILINNNDIFGILFSPHAGVRFKLPDTKMALSASVGYELQTATVKYSEPYIYNFDIHYRSASTSTSVGAVVIKVGFSF